MKKIVLLSAILIAIAGTAMAQTKSWTADNGNGTYTNPIFYDEFSDPDIIRVGEDFYLAGTTMHTVPGVVIMHSKDLVNWKFLSYCFDRFTFGESFELKNGQEEYGQGIWAPCIRYHNGKFYYDVEYAEQIPAIGWAIYLDLITYQLFCYNGDEFVQVSGVSANIELATEETAGIVKMYNSVGENTDGTMTQFAITKELDEKVELVLDEDNEMVIFEL